MPNDDDFRDLSDLININLNMRFLTLESKFSDDIDSLEYLKLNFFDIYQSTLDFEEEIDEEIPSSPEKTENFNKRLNLDLSTINIINSENSHNNRVKLSITPTKLNEKLSNQANANVERSQLTPIKTEIVKNKLTIDTEKYSSPDITLKKKESTNRSGDIYIEESNKISSSKKDIIHIKKKSLNISNSKLFELESFRKKGSFNQNTLNEDNKNFKRATHLKNKTTINDQKELKKLKNLVKGANIQQKTPFVHKSDNKLNRFKINYKSDNKLPEVEIFNTHGDETTPKDIPIINEEIIAIEEVKEESKTKIIGNGNKALLIMLTKNYLESFQRFNLITSNPQSLMILSLIKNSIKQQTEQIYNNTLLEFDEYLKDPLTEQLINKIFVPSKVAQNGFNFVGKDQELNLINTEQKEEIINIFRFVYILLNEDYFSLDPSKIIENLFQNILKKLKIDNLKTLFIQYITKDLNPSKDQINQISELYNNNPRLLNCSDLLRINKSVSYISFILKEIYDYITLKTPSGIYICELRMVNKKLKEMKEFLEKIK